MKDDLFQQRSALGQKYVNSIQGKFKQNLKRFIAEHPNKIAQIKSIAASIDQLNSKKGPNAVIMYYKSLGEDYEEFKKEFNAQIDKSA